MLGDVNVKNTGDFEIGTVNGTVGATVISGSGDIHLESVTASLTVSNDVVSAGGKHHARGCVRRLRQFFSRFVGRQRHDQLRFG